MVVNWRWSFVFWLNYGVALLIRNGHPTEEQFVNPAKPTAAARPSLYGSAKPGEVISLSIVDAATGRERVAPRPVLGARFYGGVVVGMCIVSIGLLVWMGGNEPTPAPVVATLAPIKHAEKTPQVTDNKLKTVSAVVAAPAVVASPAPVPVTTPPAVAVAEQPSVTAILGPSVSTAPPTKVVAAKKTVPAKQSVALNRSTNKTASSKPPAVVASKPKSPEKIVIASEQTKPAVRAQKHDPDVDLIEAVISRIGRK